MNRMNRYIPPGINVRLRKYSRLKKLRRLLGLPEKNMFISPGVYVQEHDWSYVTKNN
jgi:hypothetical protein